jgi:hypothetical protein
MTITNNAERLVGLRNTEAFIKANVVSIQLRRPQVTQTESGGIRKKTPKLLPRQDFRIVPMSGLVWDRSRTTPDEGSVQDVTEQLIGMPDADVEKNDYFPGENGGWFLVHHVSPVTGYRKECRLRYTSTEPKTS